jgi:hypothetical protein
MLDKEEHAPISVGPSQALDSINGFNFGYWHLAPLTGEG